MGRASRGKRDRSRPPRGREGTAADREASGADSLAAKFVAAGLDPGLVELKKAWDRLDAAAVSVLEQAKPIEDFGPLGTDELAAAVSALASAREFEGEDGERLVALDGLEDGARWVSRSCLPVVDAVRAGLGFDALAFVGSVLVMRAELANLDQARKRWAV